MMTRTDRRRTPILLAAAGALAAVALLALFGALALPVQAQTTPAVLVSNIEHASAGRTGINDDFLRAQAFSVPSGGGDYTLTSIEIPILRSGIFATEMDSLSVSLWSADSSGKPASSLHTLTNPASIAVGTTATFTAPAGATLQAGTTYVLVVHYNFDVSIGSAPGWSTTDSGDEDATSVTDWTIADSGLWRRSTSSSWADADSVQRIRVNGTAGSGTTPTLSTDATLSALVVNDGSSDLTLTPTFASNMYAYDASVGNTVDEVTVTPTKNDDGATIEWLDASDMTLTDADTSADGQQVALAEGDNVINVKVTAADTTATLTYKVTVNRPAADTTAPTFANGA